MEWSSLIGLAVAALSIFAGHSMDSGIISTLFQIKAFVIVFFGTIGALFVQTKYSDMKYAFSLMLISFRKENISTEFVSDKMHMWSRVYRESGFKAIENYISIESDVYFKKALRLISDNVEVNKAIGILKNDIYQFESKRLRAIKIWHDAGGYAPTLGILGAVLGLIQTMQNLNDPSNIGAGIAVAFVATIYGLAFANVIFIPIANRMKTAMEREIDKMEMVIDATESILKKENGLVLEERMSGYNL